MENAALLVLLESVLGKGQKTSKGNYSFVCPFHTSSQVGKKKLEINLITNDKKENPWHCWSCEAKGKTIQTLLKQLDNNHPKLKELKLIITPSSNKIYNVIIEDIKLPKEFISLSELEPLLTDRIAQIESKHAFKFLRKRGLNKNDIIKYNIGFCKEGPYSHRVIIPSYDNKGKLNYFIARDYTEEQFQKYKNPPLDTKSIIGFELYINWDAPIILVEGIFDALTIKRNVIPLFGKRIHDILMKKILSSKVNKIYIALDPDAIKSSLKYCEELLSLGKEVYLIEVEGKDASEVGFESFLNTIEKVQPLTFQTLLNRKLEI